MLIRRVSVEEVFQTIVALTRSRESSTRAARGAAFPPVPGKRPQGPVAAQDRSGVPVAAVDPHLVKADCLMRRPTRGLDDTAFKEWLT